VRWTITSDEPQRLDKPARQDRTIYTWRIAKGDEQRRVEVSLSSTAIEDAWSLSSEIREAVETKGRSAVERYLEWDDPPERVQVTNNGISIEEDAP
jgi:hypothetical protein